MVRLTCHIYLSKHTCIHTQTYKYIYIKIYIYYIHVMAIGQHRLLFNCYLYHIYFFPCDKLRAVFLFPFDLNVPIHVIPNTLYFLSMSFSTSCDCWLIMIPLLKRYICMSNIYMYMMRCFGVLAPTHSGANAPIRSQKTINRYIFCIHSKEPTFRTLKCVFNKFNANWLSYVACHTIQH